MAAERLFVERAEGWELRLDGSSVIGVRAGYAAHIEFAQGPSEPITLFQFEQPLFVRRAGQDDATIDPLDAGEFLGGLMGARVVRAAVGGTGRISIDFTDGTSVAVAPDDQYEAWNLAAGRGERLVATAGGEVAAWGPR